MEGGRLVVKHLVLENFKSYAGEKTIGPFHKGFNAVLGPNGNGKSNVIDALLFVFGKRSRKLRTKRLAELIHKSSAHQSATYARVSVHFEEIVDKDEDGFEPVAGSEFSVSRVVHANSRSDYLLNTEPVNFRHIAVYLRDKGFDIENNRFLILQGEVELIAQMKPKGANINETGFLEYLEEIIGSDQYVQEIHRLSEELEDATMKKESLQKRLRAAELEAKKLEDGKEEAETYLRKKANILALKIQRNTHSMFYLKREENEAKRSLEQVKEKSKELSPSCSKLKDALSQEKASLRGLQVSCDQTNQDLDALNKEVSEWECKDVQMKTELKHSEDEITKLTEKKTKINNDIEACTKEAKDAEQQSKRLQSAIVAMQNNLESQEERLKSLETEHAPQLARLDGELAEVRLQAAPFRCKLAEIEGTANLKKTEHQALQNKSLQSQKEGEEVQQAINTARNSLQNHVNAIQSLQAEITNKEKILKDKELAIHKETTRIDKMESQVEAAEVALAEAKKTTSSLSHQSEKMKLLLQAKTSGSIPGIIGRLGDLGCTDAKYDIAVSSCTPALDYIVVETVEDAEAAGELLKPQNLGRLTFLILSKQQHLEQRLQAPFQAPAGATRLFDVIHIQDKRLKPAFYFAFRDTLVTENLDVATKIVSQQRFNIVTLNGEVLRESGAMTGGGKPIKGKMRLGNTSTAQVMHQSEAQLLEEEARVKFNQLSQDFKEMKEKVAQEKEQIAEMKKCIEAMVGEVRTKKMEIESEERKIARMQHTLEEKQSQSQVSPEDSLRIGSLEMEISNLGQEWMGMNAEAKECFDKVEKVKRKLENVAGGAITQQKKMNQKIKDEISSNESSIVQCHWIINNAPKKQIDLENIKAELNHSLQNMEKQISVRRQEMEKMEETATVVKEKKQELKNTFDEENERCKSLGRKVEEMMKEMREYIDKKEALAAKDEDLRSSIEEFLLKQDEFEKGIHRYKAEFVECLPGEEVPSYDAEDMQLVNIDEVNYKIEESTREIDDVQVNLNTVYQYREKKQESEAKATELETFIEHRTQLMNTCEELKAKRLNEFLSGFHLIRGQLKRVYRLITNGGDADLDLIDSLDPFSEGIEFSVRPPKKSWKRIANLSGGEKTLSSLSLIFALHYYRPTALYVMDEIDAALDFRNVAIAAEYIAKRTGNAQFIVVSLRSQMFDRASRLIGVYKVNDCTNTVTINPKTYLSTMS